MATLSWIVLLWSLNVNAFSFNLEKTRLQAEKISRELHLMLEENAGKSQLEKAYKTTSCSTVAREKPEVFLDRMVLSIEKRFNDTRTALLRSKAAIMSHGVHNITHGKALKILVQDCCTDPLRPLSYIARFHTEVNTSLACVNTNLSSSSRKEILVETYRNNLEVSSVVSWQYFGSSQGHYFQYPSSRRVCNSSQLFDPRFKSWYVNAASRAHVNVILIIDRSLSMASSGRMKLARQAGLTVLETLGADDSIGVFSFSSNVNIPSGCFGDVIAQANPSNINRLKKWVKVLQPFGGTKYVPAFIHAFKMLESIRRQNKTTNATNVILFLTDGDPFDSDDAIFNAIQQGQNVMQNRTIINTYGLGNSLRYNAKQRLQKIADQNSGTFTHIRDSDASGLRSIMGQYYSDIPGTIRDSPVISLPRLDKDLGLVTTMSAVCLDSRNDVTGVVAQDVAVSELLKEVVDFSASDGLSYASVIDTKGRTIIHPSVPKPTDHLVDPVFQSLSLYEPSVKEEMLQRITGGMTGYAAIMLHMSSSRGDPQTDGIQTVVANATFTWRPVRSSPYIVILVTPKEQIETAQRHQFVAQNLRRKSHYHRLDLTMNKLNLSTTLVCNRKGFLVSRLFSTVKLAPEAFNDSSVYVTTPETLPGVISMETFFNSQSPQATYPGLSESVRVEVKLTAQLENTWNESEHRNPNMAEWRFVATNGGVFRVFPGIRLQKTYSHLRQPWYTRAVSNAGGLTISRSLSNTSGLQSPGSLLSLLTTFKAPRCNTGIPPSSQTTGVVGIQLSQSSFNKILTRIPGLCDRFQQDCFIMDNSGYIVSDILNPNKDISRHVTQAFPWLALNLASQDNFVKTSWCNNLEDHVVQLFHSLALPREAVWSGNGTTPCRQYHLVALPDTNAYLLVLRSRVMYGCNENSAAECNQCEDKCSNCTGNSSPCQCPCSCSMKYDECTNSVTGLWTGIPCLASIPKARDTSVGIRTNVDALLKVPTCPTPCDILSNEVDCNSSGSCHWCRHASFPACSEVCRTNKRIDVFIPFPCNDFTKLSPLQKYDLGKSFIKTLVKISPQLTTTALDTPEFNATGIRITLHGTTDGILLSSHREKIMDAVEAKSFSVAPTTNVNRAYTAKTTKEYTDLQVYLSMSPWPATPLSDEQRLEAKNDLQNVLDSLLEESFASKARGVHVKRGIISFALSNQGHVSRYSIQNITENLVSAVQNRRFSIEIANTQVFAKNISTLASFEYFCNPKDSTTTLPSVQPSSDDLLTTLPTATEEFEPKEKRGIIPTEIFIVFFTALGVASCCPFVLFYVFRKRKKTGPSRRTATPETEIEENVASEDSQLIDEENLPSATPVNSSRFTRRDTIDSMQVVPEWSRSRHQNPLQPVPSEENLPESETRPHTTEHRTSLISKKIKNSQESRGERLEVSASARRKMDWKESVRRLQEKKCHEMKNHLAALPGGHSQENLSEKKPASTNARQETTYLSQNTFHTPDSFPKTSSFKQGFIDCDIDTIATENTKIIPRPVNVRGGIRKNRRSQSNRDISMATFRIFDANTSRRQSFHIPNHSGPRSLRGEHGVISTLNGKMTEGFDTTTALGRAKPIRAWASSKRPRLTSRNSSLI